MSAPKLWNAPTIVPILAYEEVTKAVEWLARAFGFRERPGSHLSWSGGSMTWLEVGDGLVQVLTSGGHEIHSPRTVQGNSQALKFYVEDVDRHFQQAKAAGARILSEPVNGFWGGRFYTVPDHEGHRWEFSQRGVDLAAHLWQLPPGVTRR